MYYYDSNRYWGDAPPLPLLVVARFSLIFLSLWRWIFRKSWFSFHKAVLDQSENKKTVWYENPDAAANIYFTMIETLCKVWSNELCNVSRVILANDNSQKVGSREIESLNSFHYFMDHSNQISSRLDYRFPYNLHQQTTPKNLSVQPVLGLVQ